MEWRAVRAGPWKWVLPKNQPAQLYDLSHDLEEKHNLAAENPAKLEELAEQWKAWHAAMPPPQRHEKVPPPAR